MSTIGERIRGVRKLHELDLLTLFSRLKPGDHIENLDFIKMKLKRDKK